MAELRDETSELVKMLKGDAKGGWGFGVINVGGSYERNSEEKTHKIELSEGTLKISGLQMVGCQCEVMAEKRPSPKEGLNWVEAG